MIIHQGRAIKIARTTLPNDFVGQLTDLKGSPSDGYSATVLDVNGIPVAKAVNYMDGTGWVIYSPK